MNAAVLNARRRKVVSKAVRLHVSQQTTMYKLLLENNANMNVNQNGAFCDLAYLSEATLVKVEQFVGMCFADIERNAARDAEVEVFQKELDQAAALARPAESQVPPLTRRNNDLLKSLTALERSVAKEQSMVHANVNVSEQDACGVRKSNVPKFAGVKANLLRTCRQIGRSQSGAAIVAGRRRKSKAACPTEDVPGHGPSDGEASDDDEAAGEDDEAAVEDDEAAAGDADADADDEE
jgi:hypothetical protein